MEQSSDKVIHVSNLPRGITADFLKTLFKECGNVLNVTIKERPYGNFAFISFETPEAALTAIKEFNYTKLNGMPIIITPTTQEYQNLIKSGEGNLYVKGLDEYIEISQLHELFQTYGEVISCKLPTNPDGKNRGFAYVQFKDPKDAENARVELSDATINGKKITVENYQKKSPPPRSNQQAQNIPVANEETFTNIFIKNLPDSVKNVNDLGKLFSEFGLVVSAKLLPDGQSGFCNMFDHDSAVRAVQALNGRIVGGKVIEAIRAKGKEERMNMGMKPVTKHTPPTFSPGFGTTSTTYSPPTPATSQQQTAFGASSTTTISSQQTTYGLSNPLQQAAFGGSSSPFSQPAFGQQAAAKAAPAFSSQATTFGAPSAASAFGQPSSAFNPSTSYGTQSAFGQPFGAQAAQKAPMSNPYGSAFGTATATYGTAGAYNASKSSPYGAPYGSAASPYGTPYGSSASAYGMPQARAPVGSTASKYGSAFGAGPSAFGAPSKAQVYSANGQ